MPAHRAFFGRRQGIGIGQAVGCIHPRITGVGTPVTEPVFILTHVAARGRGSQNDRTFRDRSLGKNLTIIISEEIKKPLLSEAFLVLRPDIVPLTHNAKNIPQRPTREAH